MKMLVRAVLNPARRPDALRLLARFGVANARVEEVTSVRFRENAPRFSRWMLVEFTLPEENLDEVLLALCAACRTGRPGNDGSIHVLRCS